MTDKTTMQTALTWYDHGVTPIPCRPKSKIPAVAWGRWQRRRPSEQLVKHWFSQDRNLALMTGDPLLVLDFDRLSAYYQWKLDNPNLAESYTVKTPRPGRHVYFNVDKPLSSMHLDGIDVRGTNVLVMAPPSTHPSGELYVAGDMPIMDVNGLTEVLPGWEQFVNSVKSEGSYSHILPGTHSKSAPSLFTESPYYRNDLVGRVKTALPILTLLSRYTMPIPSSRDGRWYVMKCPHPAHHDRNPSFWADARRGICGCFKPSCAATQPNGKAMDIFNVWSWLHNCGNRDAIRELKGEIQYGI